MKLPIEGNEGSGGAKNDKEFLELILDISITNEFILSTKTKELSWYLSTVTIFSFLRRLRVEVSMFYYIQNRRDMRVGYVLHVRVMLMSSSVK